MKLHIHIITISLVTSILLMGCGDTTNNKEASRGTTSDTNRDSQNSNSDTENRTSRVKSNDIIWNVSNVTELRQALENASANGENDKIILSAGVYKTTSDNLGTFTFDDNEEFNLTIEAKKGLTSSDVVLNGNHSTQVLNFNNQEISTLILKNISVVDGNSSKEGGGIYSNQNIELYDCNISNNTVASWNIGGGGFYSSKNTILSNSIISNNSSDNGSGGGFYSNGKTTVINSTIFNNTARNYGGGFYSNKETIVNNSTISDNTIDGKSNGLDTRGGGFYSLLKTTVTNSTISNNNSMGFSSNGGGFEANELTIITNSIISNNSASRYGGGFTSWGTTIATNNIFVNNSAKKGDSFYSSSYLNPYSYISNNNFIDNNGSIYAKGVFVNNIFDSNNANITLDGDSKIYNNYIDYTKIEDNEKNVVKKKNLQPISIGDVYLNSDHKTLASNSPVIDKGLNPSSETYKKIIGDDEVYNILLKLLKTDMQGNKRVHNGTIDMGAVEFGSSK